MSKPTYFKDLNYTLANEDTTVEQEFLAKAKQIVAIGGSGSRVFPLIHAGVERIDVVDVSLPQLEFVRFKFELIQKLERQDFLKVMGYIAAHGEERARLLRLLPLSNSSRSFLSMIPLSHLDKGLIYSGRWESKILLLSRIIRRLLGFNFEIFFEAKSIEEQTELVARFWPELRLKILLRAIANRHVVNKFIYKGQMATQGGDLSFPEFLEKNFRTATREHLLRNSFFHQLLFLGCLRYEVGFPLEAKPSVFQQAKTYGGILNFHNRDLLGAVSELESDAYSLSDVVSYLAPAQRQALASGLSNRLQTRASTVIIRTFLDHTRLQGTEAFAKPAFEKRATQLDSTQLYQFQICSSL